MRAFTKDLIAPCGLDCSLCRHYLENDRYCQGCRGPKEYKYSYCKERCEIMNCEKWQSGKYQFCIECPDFPCPATQEKEDRYQTKYVLKESPYTNMRKIRDAGIEQFMKEEKAQWTCPQCGGVICVHTGVCRGCQ